MRPSERESLIAQIKEYLRTLALPPDRFVEMVERIEKTDVTVLRGIVNGAPPIAWPGLV